MNDKWMSVLVLEMVEESTVPRVVKVKSYPFRDAVPASRRAALGQARNSAAQYVMDKRRSTPRVAQILEREDGPLTMEAFVAGSIKGRLVDVRTSPQVVVPLRTLAIKG